MNKIQKRRTHSYRAYWKILCAITMGCVFINVSAQSIFGRDKDDDEPVKKVETAVVLPPFPVDENLLAFDVSPTQTQTFSIDTKSLSLANDRDEVRYTLVSVSQSGAKNISYEGVRCSTFEVRHYAYGHPNGEWSLSGSDKWRPIQFYAPNRPQATLVEDYFCDQKITEGKPADMLERIRYRRSLMKRRYNAN